MMSILGSLEIA